MKYCWQIPFIIESTDLLSNFTFVSCTLKSDYHLAIIHPLHNASRGEGGYLDLLRYCLIYMESYSMARYDRGRGSQ